MTEQAKITHLRPTQNQNSGQQASFDPWGGDNGAGYDVDKTYTRSVNKHDHSTNIQTHVPKDVAGRIDELVQKGLIPAYKGRQDFVRDAIIHRLHYICEEKKVFTEASEDIQAEMNACYLQQQRSRIAKWQSNIEEARNLLMDLRMSNNEVGIKVQVEKIVEIAETMPEPYRSQMRAVTGQ